MQMQARYRSYIVFICVRIIMKHMRRARAINMLIYNYLKNSYKYIKLHKYFEKKKDKHGIYYT
jgi:hypothetical protein